VTVTARFPLPTDLSREELASPGAAVERIARLEAAVERVFSGVLRDFLGAVADLAERDGAALTLGGVWLEWSQRFGAAIAELPPVAGAWLSSAIAESDIPDAAYASALAVLTAAQAEGWSARTRDDQLRLALRPTEGETSLLAAASRRGPRHGARWDELDVGGMSFMDRMKRDARTAVTGLDGILTSSALRDQGFTRKRWVTRHDAKVRETHFAAEGQTVPLEEPFTVGGYPLMYPGERGAPPALVINCRCTMVGTRWRARGAFPQGRGLVP
jgi:hypothetical protein